MAQLEQYPTLKEKSIYFEGGDIRINTKAEFEVYWEKLENYHELDAYKFRGSSEAKYKLYNSSQRYWIEKELYKQEILYHNFIKKLIEKSKRWNERTISKFFNLSGISANNALAYLSYMQHYGIPTPLLDFTDNPFIGLYFAVASIPDNFSSDHEIDNYCSLYIVDQANAYLFGTLKNFEKALANEKNGDIDYDKYLISYPVLFVANKNMAFKMLNNTNIVNQDGLFYYNNNPTAPIESVYREEINDIKETISPEEFSKLDYSPHFSLCWNFHKNLKKYILSKLEEKNINEKYIFPNNINFKEYTLLSALKEI